MNSFSFYYRSGSRSQYRSDREKPKTEETETKTEETEEVKRANHVLDVIKDGL